jgi:glycosyltransferase involved in cell wall biosynthesis
MRVLWLSPWLRPIARNCAESLIALGADVMLVTADLHPESDEARDYETVLLGRPVPTADWMNIAKTYRKAKQFKPDVVVTELLRDPRWRIFGSLAPRIRLMHDDKPHDETHAEPWWIRSFEPWDARADATIVFSDYVAERLRGRQEQGSPIYVAPLMTDLHPSKVPEFMPANQRKNFVLIGRQRPYKNHAIVFAAWKAHTQGSAYRGDELVLLGEGDISHALPPHTRWIRTDYKYSDVVDELARAKGSLVHARSASQSGVHVMSMQLGVPPLVSTAGALPEYQPPGLSVTGIDDVSGLSRAIDALADPAEVEVQSRIALDHYRNHYDAPLAAKRLLEIFDDVLIRAR